MGIVADTAFARLLLMSEIIDTLREARTMRKLILISSAVLAFAALLASGTSGAAAAPSKAPLIIAMHDPGCHWFYVGGGPNHRNYAKSVTRSGPVTLLNLDEAAMIIKGPGGTKTEPVGAKLTLKAKGIYHLTMVCLSSRRQPSDPQDHLSTRA